MFRSAKGTARENAATAVCNRPVITARELSRRWKYSSGLAGQKTSTGPENSPRAIGKSAGSLQQKIKDSPFCLSLFANAAIALKIGRPTFQEHQNCRLLLHTLRGGKASRVWRSKRQF